MPDDDIWNAETAQAYDTLEVGMFSLDVLISTVDRLALLAGSGPALEFAIGTGRVAIPLRERGIPVTGIEKSSAMIERLRAKVDAAAIPVVPGDMATTVVPGRFALVYLVYNTLSNLLTQADQIACFRNAARHLAPGGCFVVELCVPELRKLPQGQKAVVWKSEQGYIAVDTYDLPTQHVVSHHFRFTEDGQTRLFRSAHRYIWPAELDLMGQLAGLELETRHADWNASNFTGESQSHVSVYRKPNR